jgi:Mrp family chromosome partitioning ATPase
VGLLLLFGILNRRYRYSDEAATDVAASSSAPLLGILPALCDRFDDPEHAASAAQCIHQIRAVLQASRPEARQGVYLVTSSTPGEGKTSVAVSLALSFAASGARTLLVDCDIVGQSITRGFGADSRPGLRDALTRGTVRGFAHRTAVGPYLIGVGTTDVLDAAVVSSIAVRRLLLDARRYFDAIIVDSGPILGSIEATAVAPEVDGVIFAVSRGQQPALAEKAIRHLQAIGATIGGFIFNRAAAKDFGGWSHSSSLRSFGSKAGGGGSPRPPLTERESLSTFGPLVRAVASLMPGGRALLAAPGPVNPTTHAAVAPAR